MAQKYLNNEFLLPSMLDCVKAEIERKKCQQTSFNWLPTPFIRTPNQFTEQTKETPSESISRPIYKTQSAIDKIVNMLSKSKVKSISPLPSN